jgi:hypothetical protein
LVILGSGTVNEEGNVHIMGNFGFSSIPIEGDLNEGAKIWFFLSEDIGDASMDGWNPERYLVSTRE